MSRRLNRTSRDHFSKSRASVASSLFNPHSQCRLTKPGAMEVLSTIVVVAFVLALLEKQRYTLYTDIMTFVWGGSRASGKPNWFLEGLQVEPVPNWH